MKRTNVIVDEDLLERARRATGERTYSATITKALQEVVRIDRLNRALDRFYAEAGNGGFFSPEFLQEYRASAMTPRKQKISADEKRAPRKGARRRAR